MAPTNAIAAYAAARLNGPTSGPIKVMGKLSLLNAASDNGKARDAFPSDKVSVTDPLSRPPPVAALRLWLKDREINTLKSP